MNFDFVQSIGSAVHNTISSVNPGGYGGGLLGIPFGIPAALGLGKMGSDLWDSATQKPDIQSPQAPPQMGQANVTALNQELQQERNMRSTWNILTGGTGVLDQPTVHSQQLLGS